MIAGLVRRLRLLLCAPRDWWGVARWGAGARSRPDRRRLVHAVVHGDAGVLLALRRELRGWELPGGRVEPGEAEERALAREVREETGLRVEAVSVVGEYRRTGFAAHQARVYRCRVVGGALRPSPDTPAVAWFPVAEVPDTLFPWFRGPLEDALTPAHDLDRAEHLGVGAIVRGIAIDLRERWRGTGG